jgi:uncharacterized repeat protein (TIGR03803 family)
MTRITRIMRLPAIVFAWVALLAASTPLYAQSRYEVMNSLDGTASGRLVQASNGNLYGVTYVGGEFGFGTVFRLTPDGALTTIASFSGEMGVPAVGSGLLQANDGDLYGATEGGATAAGTIFRVTVNADGTASLSTWAAFDGATIGSTPSGRLIEGNDGYLYGTALFGPEDGSGVGAAGLVFRVNRAKATTDATGTIEQVAVFPSDGSAGEFPSAGLVQAADGSFYGTAEFGGANFVGAIFRVANGQVSAVHSFGVTDGVTGATDVAGGANPAAPLLLSGSNLYGTTMAGGVTGFDGTLFRFSLDSYTLTTLGSFDFTNGSMPYQQGVIEAAGYLYGTTFGGGVSGFGTAYRWSEATGIELLHSTGSVANESPDSTITLAKDGTIYGTAVTPPTGGVIFRILSDASLQVSPVRANYGGTATLVATLTQLGAPKANASIRFSISGVELGSATTGTDGVATLNVSVAGLGVGSHPNAIVASFAGVDGVLPTTARGDLTIEFMDATPPTLRVPASMVVNATSPLGATVTFEVTATDNSGGAVAIACSPASGTMFRIGVTTVTCTATDVGGNVSRDSFKVKVLSAAEQIVDLVEKLPGTRFEPMVKKLLKTVLQAAIANPKKATIVCYVLEQFISYVTKHAAADPTLANALIVDARRIQAVIGCL